MRSLKAFSADTGGATAVEYGILAALISLALAFGLTAVGDSILSVFSTVGEHMTIN